ncbi:MAG: alpha-glucosidase [Bacillota bacterium]|nr:alpha-glucosidase [Bacillota bacterium]
MSTAPPLVPWRDAVIYQIYPRSFQDSDGDGVGDLNGIRRRLPELERLGVDYLWLSPVYASPGVDNGYDVSDYYAIDPLMGTLEDMDALIAEARERGIGIVMDLILNHTSDQHAWFQESRDPASPRRNWYHWCPSPPGQAPNNWTGFFGGGCWTRDDGPGGSGDSYLHLFAPGQPDLNWAEPAVFDTFVDIIRFWTDRGVAGFRLDVINVLWKDSLADGRRSLILTGSEHYLSRPHLHTLLQQLRRQAFAPAGAFTVGETVFVDLPAARQLTAPEREELDMVFPFEHMESDQIIVKWITRPFHPRRLFAALRRWQENLDWNAVYLENHDQPRLVPRFGDARRYPVQSATLYAVLLLTLRGTPFIYQGQELGLLGRDWESLDELQDVESHQVYGVMRSLRFPARLAWFLIRLKSRDNARQPYPWSAEHEGGFTSGRPWLRLHRAYREHNYAAQAGRPGSVLEQYRLLLELRRLLPVLREGSFRSLYQTGRLFVYERRTAGPPAARVIVALNAGSRPLAFHRSLVRRLPDHLHVIYSNYDGEGGTVDRIKQEEAGLFTANADGRHLFAWRLRPWEAVILA